MAEKHPSRLLRWWAIGPWRLSSSTSEPTTLRFRPRWASNSFPDTWDQKTSSLEST